ncbi:unnamed protein product [Amoebophrya sp. A120]|nr:unnamed protein product [Amoebophrya sp. A120]|eukprot:GSA120T00009112001.1
MQYLRSALGQVLSSGGSVGSSGGGGDYGADISHQPTSSSSSSSAKPKNTTTPAKLAKYIKLLQPLGLFEEHKERYADLIRKGSVEEEMFNITGNDMMNMNLILSRIVDLRELSKLLWSGAPGEYPHLRAITWRLLLGIAPNAKDRHLSTLARKRREYHELCRQHWRPNMSTTAGDEQQLIRQIRVDLPRTSAGALQPLFQEEKIHAMMERILFVWALRHPGCGYVQGINDLLTPFLVVFLAEKEEAALSSSGSRAASNSAAHLQGPSEGDLQAGLSRSRRQTKSVDYEQLRIDSFTDEELADVEADSFLCLTKMLDSMQDHYTPNQPGIQRMMAALKTLLKRTNMQLASHLEELQVEMLQVSFRWFNCLLAREIPIECVIRLWDTYIAELHDRPSDFDQFLTFFVMSFLNHWEKELIHDCAEFQQVIMFLQKLPTDNWQVWNLELLLTNCHILSAKFAGAHEKAELMKSLRINQT